MSISVSRRCGICYLPLKQVFRYFNFARLEKNLKDGICELLCDTDYTELICSGHICRTCKQLFEGIFKSKNIIRENEKKIRKLLLIKKACSPSNLLTCHEEKGQVSNVFSISMDQFEDMNTSTSTTANPISEHRVFNHHSLIPSTTSTSIEVQTTESCFEKFNSKVVVNYQSGTKIRKTYDEFSHKLCSIICSSSKKNFAMKIANAVYEKDEGRKHLMEKFICDISREAKSLCAKKYPSLLRSKEAIDLDNFSPEEIYDEWRKRAPLIFGCLCAMADESPASENIHPSLSVAGSMLLCTRNQELNLLQHCLGLCLDAGGLKDKTITVLNKLNMCVSTTTIQRKKHELVHRHDGMLHDIKTELEEEENCGKISISGDGGMNKIDQSEMQSLNMNRPIGCPDDAGCLPVHHTKNSTCVTSKYIEGINVSQTINSFDNVVKNEQVIDIDITPFEVDDEKKNTVTHSDSQENVAEDEAPSLMHNDIDNEDVLDEFNQPAVNFDNYDQEHGPFLLQRVEPMSF